MKRASFSFESFQIFVNRSESFRISSCDYNAPKRFAGRLAGTPTFAPVQRRQHATVLAHFEVDLLFRAQCTGWNCNTDATLLTFQYAAFLVEQAGRCWDDVLALTFYGQWRMSVTQISRETERTIKFGGCKWLRRSQCSELISIAHDSRFARAFRRAHWFHYFF